MRYQEVLLEFHAVLQSELPEVTEGTPPVKLPARRIFCVCDTPEQHLCCSRKNFRFWPMDSLQDSIEVMRAGFAAQNCEEELISTAIKKLHHQQIGRERPVYFCTYLVKI